MEAPIGFDPRKRFLEPRISPSRCLYALHCWVTAQKRLGNARGGWQVPATTINLEMAAEFWQHMHWSGDGTVKAFGLVLGAFLPVRLAASHDGGIWHVQVDTQPFDAYYGERAAHTAFMCYFKASGLGFDDVQIPTTELADDGESTDGNWHPPMLLPEGELSGAALVGFNKRRMRPGEAAAREAGKLSLQVGEQLLVECQLEDPPSVAVVPAAEKRTGMSAHQWATKALAEPETLRDQLDAELNGRDDLTGAILRRVKLED